MPKRSLFYGLPLEGVGTWEVESLRSFIERLAYAHCFKPLALLEKLLAHFPLGEAKLSLLAVVKFWDVHGTANAGHLVTERLELATLTKLASAGLRRFAHVLSPAHLARSKDDGAVYCPACVAEGDELGHGRLLWEVQCVTACPKHKVLLRSAKVCGAPDEEKVPVNRRPALHSVCGECGSIGFRCVKDAPDVAPASAVWVAEQVGALLALSDKTVEKLTAPTLVAGIKDLVDKVFCGSAVRAALESGLARATVWNWLKGSRPSLSQLVQVCVHGNADLVALFNGRYSPVSETGEALSLSKKLADRPYVRTPLTDEQMSAALTEALDAAEAVSAAKVCARLGVDPKTARNRFPELTHRLGQRFLAASAEDGRRRCRAAQDAYVKAASDLRAEGKTVGVKSVQRRAGLVAFSLHPGRLRSLNEAIAQVVSDAGVNPEKKPS